MPFHWTSRALTTDLSWMQWITGKYCRTNTNYKKTLSYYHWVYSKQYLKLSVKLWLLFYIPLVSGPTRSCIVYAPIRWKIQVSNIAKYVYSLSMNTLAKGVSGIKFLLNLRLTKMSPYRKKILSIYVIFFIKQLSAFIKIFLYLQVIRRAI